MLYGIGHRFFFADDGGGAGKARLVGRLWTEQTSRCSGGQRVRGDRVRSTSRICFLSRAIMSEEGEKRERSAQSRRFCFKKSGCDIRSRDYG